MSGMYFEGCSWDYENGFITEQNSKELYSRVPIMLLKPSEIKDKVASQKGAKGSATFIEKYDDASIRDSVNPSMPQFGSSAEAMSEKSAFAKISDA